MDRRNFITGAAAAGAFVPPVLGPTSALSTELQLKDKDGRPIDPFTAVAISLGSRLIPITTLVLFLATSLWSMRLSDKVPTSPADVALPFGGPFMRHRATSIDQRWKEPTQVGLVFLALPAILVLLVTARSLVKPPPATVITSKDKQWEPISRYKPLSADKFPSRQKIQSGTRQVGRVYVNPKGEVVAVAGDSKVRLKSS